ncbi:MAG TPA: cytochrome b562 [Acidobacteriota bacterium]|nr:cytochrome b562 [Acidobacteriota bacterium]
MKRLAYLILVFLFTNPLLISKTSTHSGGAESSSQEDVPPIVAHMRQVNQNLRQLRRQLTADKQDENLKLIREIRKHLEKAREEEPLKTPELPAQERDSFLKGYQVLIGKVLSKIDRLEASVSDGNLEQAEALLADLNNMKKEGHQKYQKEE